MSEKKAAKKQDKTLEALAQLSAAELDARQRGFSAKWAKVNGATSSRAKRLAPSAKIWAPWQSPNFSPEDLFQEVALRLWGAALRGTLQGVCNFPGYAHRTLTWMSCSTYKQQRNRARAWSYYCGTGASDTANAENDTDEDAYAEDVPDDCGRQSED